MKKYYLLPAFIIFATNTYAGVRPIVDSVTPHSIHSELKAPKNNQKNKEKLCKKHGYTKNKCPEQKIPVGMCPFDHSYFAQCCPSNYKYIKAECYKQKLIPSVNSCFGFHACIKPKIKKENNGDALKPKENNSKQ